MSEMFLTDILPQLAGSAAHTRALGFSLESVIEDRIRLRVPWRADLVGDIETGVLAGGLVTAALDHVGGLATWVKLGGFRPIATLDLRVDYMRAARSGADLIAEARCYRMTNHVAFVRAWAFEDTPEDPVAAAQAAYVVNDIGNSRLGVNLKPQEGAGS